MKYVHFCWVERVLFRILRYTQTRKTLYILFIYLFEKDELNVSERRIEGTFAFCGVSGVGTGFALLFIFYITEALFLRPGIILTLYVHAPQSKDLVNSLYCTYSFVGIVYISRHVDMYLLVL